MGGVVVLAVVSCLPVSREHGNEDLMKLVLHMQLL